MSLNNFIPTLWADTLLPALRANLVYGNLFNDDYEGTIAQMGDTVKINSIGDITIYSYTKDTDLNSPQSLTDAQSMLTISQAKYYNFEVDDVDAAQAQPKVMGEAMSFAAYELANTMDQYYAGFYADAVNNIGSSGSPITPTVATATATGVGSGTTVYDYLVVLNQKLTESKAPKQGRWCTVPPWITTLLIQDIRFTSFNTPDARLTIQTNKLDASGGMISDAYLGKISGMDVYESINAPHLSGTIGVTGSTDVVMAGHTMSLTKAEGLNKVEAFRPPARFADAVKGLCLYGAKTIRPYALAAAYLAHP
ncbi:MAG: P22 coat protein - protein 5 domain protein [Ktedonobacteraceae bacterium]